MNKPYSENEGVAPVFEKEVNPNTPAGEVQGFANIAGAFNDKRDPVRRLYARIMVFAVLVVPIVGFAILFITESLAGK